MSEATKPKYDSLPGIDTAPDVYETPDLAEDVSTIQASTAVSESDDEGASDAEESAVRHQRLQADQARNRFQPSRVDARGVDFSDNITAQRRSYRTSTRGQRRRGEVLGDDSDEEKESFTRKLQRVHKEFQELEIEYKKRVESGDKSKYEERDSKDVMEFLSDKMDWIYTKRRGGIRGAEPWLAKTIQKFDTYPDFKPSARVTKALANLPPPPGSQVQKSQLEYVLNQAASFDARITHLETSLGFNGSTMPDISDKSVFPVIVTLEKLENLLGTMSDASGSNLETAAQHVKKLIADAEHLKELRLEATRAGGPANSSTTTPPSADAKPFISPEQDAKVNALYGTLPTIDRLSPMLPIIIERLRTLRLVHTSAWQADTLLTELEAKQARVEHELQMFNKMLDTNIKDQKTCEDKVKYNMEVVGGWVKGLEERVKKLNATDGEE
ncbi:hypothetical protein BDV95DRAFT_498605 [Massariosphaeria phaeospora]|uniref:Dynamitin-domain-containing protein n=1 Tax=Massariosphaeria phaeospora TaxID=100035 RepID=A0A7C8I7M1_9PLEO|nr:hypothetical protein BDV95DRAFT_498605 [Massariosphaeria phaeospora]